jgi:hypothetical protein
LGQRFRERVREQPRGMQRADRTGRRDGREGVEVAHARQRRALDVARRRLCRAGRENDGQKAPRGPVEGGPSEGEQKEPVRPYGVS